MNTLPADQILQLATWFLTLVEFILGLYILLLNVWHTANRHVSALLMIFVINNLAIGMLMGATSATQATWPTYLLAATSFAILPWLLITTIILLKPQWLRGKWRRLWWPVYILSILPALLTLLDIGLGTQLYYVGFDPATYSGGYIPLSEYTTGSLALLVNILNIRMTAMVSVILMLYIALRDKTVPPVIRRLTWMLLGAYTATLVLRLGLSEWLGADITTLITAAIFVFAYAYAAFRQMISERRLQRGRLQPRLIILILGVTIPLILAVGFVVSERAGELLQQNAVERLEVTNRALGDNVQMWLRLTANALKQLVSLPDIVSMDAERQKPILEAMAAAYPHIYLVSTTDRGGINVARSDDLPPKDYHDRSWQIGAMNDAPVTYQVLVEQTSNESVLAASMPIRNEQSTIVGVGMFAAELDDITQQVHASEIGETGFTLVVDAQNHIVAYSDLEISAGLQDLNTYPPILALRRGERGTLTFSDDKGQRWRAHIDILENDWGIIVQQTEGELLSDLAQLRQIAWGILLVGVLLVSGTAWLTLRQAFQPLDSLTATVTAITAGDLTQVAPIESEDEIGVLARAFNNMTERVRVLVSGLESQVADRTHDLERRTVYLTASTEVSRAAASILDKDQLMREVVEVIREQFGLYYVGLFIKVGEWAVLQAGTGEAGQTMLARGHQLRIGEGMIGWSVAQAQLRVALDIREDAVQKPAPELPDTRSEAAIPLRSRGQVLGALTVQHIRPDAFDQMAVDALQTMADQVAVALDNARLFTASQEALESTRRAYGELGRQAWSEVLSTQIDLAFRSDAQGIHKITSTDTPRIQASVATDASDGTDRIQTIPIKIHGQTVGMLDTYKPDDAGDWTPTEVEMLKTITAQLQVALESARLYDETQRRAAREQLTAEVATRMRETLDIETVLKTATNEIYQALGLDEVEIYLMRQDQ